MHLQAVRPACLVGLVVDVEHQLRVKDQVRRQYVVLFWVLAQLLHELAVTRARPHVGGDALAHPDVLGRFLRAIDQPGVVDRPEVNVRQVHQLHLGSLEVVHVERHLKDRRAGVQLDQGFGDIVVAKSHRVLVLAAQADVGPTLVLPHHDPGALVRRVRQFPVQWMRVFS